MSRTYRPSGKVSALFVPVYALALLLTAVCAFVCVFGIRFSPYTVFDAVICFFMTKGVAKYGASFTVRCGRVRNPRFAAISGLGVALWYECLLAVWYMRGEESPGLAVTGKSGTVLFVLPETAAAALGVVLGIAAAIWITVEFRRAGEYPFFERSGKWARETVLVRCKPEDEAQCREALLRGESGLLTRLLPLYELNTNHWKLSLFSDGGRESFFVSVSRMESTGEVDRRSGKPTFEETALITYLEIEGAVGNALLLHRSDKEDAAVRVVTDESKRRAGWRLVYNALFSVIFIAFGAYCLFQMDKSELAEFLERGGFFYFALLFLGNAVRFIRSFEKERVFESAGLSYGAKRYLTTETTEPAAFKLFYLFLMLAGAVLFGICMWNMYGWQVLIEW